MSLQPEVKPAHDSKPERLDVARVHAPPPTEPALEDVEINVLINGRVVPRQLVEGDETIASVAGPFSIQISNPRRHSIVVILTIDDSITIRVPLYGNPAYTVTRFRRDEQYHLLAFAAARMADRTEQGGAPGSIKARVYTAHFKLEERKEDKLLAESKARLPVSKARKVPEATAKSIDRKHHIVSGGVIDVPVSSHAPTGPVYRSYTARYLGDKILFYRPAEQIHDLLHPYEPLTERRAREAPSVMAAAAAAAAATSAGRVSVGATAYTRLATGSVYIELSDEDEHAKRPSTPSTASTLPATQDAFGGDAANTQSTTHSQPLVARLDRDDSSVTTVEVNPGKRKFKINGIVDDETRPANRKTITIGMMTSGTVADMRRNKLEDMDFGTAYRFFDVQNKRVIVPEQEETVLLSDVGDTLRLDRLDEPEAAAIEDTKPTMTTMAGAGAGAAPAPSITGQKRTHEEAEIEEADDDSVEEVARPVKQAKVPPLWELARQHSGQYEVRRAIRNAFSPDEYRTWVPYDPLDPSRTDIAWEKMVTTIQVANRDKPLMHAVGFYHIANNTY